MERFRELLDLVKKVRAAQKSYYKTYTTTDLRQAKILERELDKLLEKIEQESRQPKTDNGQLSLLGGM